MSEIAASTDTTRAAQVTAGGRYGWYVETDEPTPEDGIVVGDYISVSSEGALYVWGPDRELNYAFEPGTWKFVFPKFGIMDKVTTSDGRQLDHCIFMGDLEDPRTMSKQSSLMCKECAEQHLGGELAQQLIH